MHTTIARNLVAVIGRTAVALAMWAAAPLESFETIGEAEIAVVAENDSLKRVEPFRQCVRHGQLHYGTHTPEQSIGLTTFCGYSGRRLSPELLAPIRC